MSERLVWIDMEMTGLDVETDVILEIATVVTDENLNVLDQTPNMVISHPPEFQANLNEWSAEHHAASGLLDEVEKSMISLAEAEAVSLAMVSKHVGRQQAPLCGNSVWQDRRFLCKYLPTLENFLHYRIVDVSSMKELVRIWLPELTEMVPQKQKTHRALDDIHESIAELKFYQGQIFQR